MTKTINTALTPAEKRHIHNVELVYNFLAKAQSRGIVILS